MTFSSNKQDDPPVGAPQAPGRLQRALFAVGESVRKAVLFAAPHGRVLAARVGDWLATVGWWRFIAVSLLLLAIGGVIQGLLFGGDPAPADRAVARPVKIEVAINDEGLTVKPSSDRSPAAAGAGAARGAASASVSVSEDAVRIRTHEGDRQVTLRIGADGIVRETAPSSAAGAAPEPATAVVIRGADMRDPDRLAEAVERARGRIEQLVADQVDARVEQEAQMYRERSGEWFMSLLLALLASAALFKVVLGSKKKAEQRADSAAAAAAAEGLRRQLAEAQLKMMQAQVEPHFLFNTLASVDYLIETDPGRASRMQKNLIRYLRSSLPQMREGSSTLGQEVQLCAAYLEILKVRMEDRLQFAIDVPAGLHSAQFPPMMLQSLVENAIQHGLEPKADGGSLSLTASVVDGDLQVAVADTGLGFGAAGPGGTRIGLANIRERLAALYGDKAAFRIDGAAAGGVCATIRIPYKVGAVAA